MLLFLLIFLLIYSSMHTYAFLKAREALSFGAPAGIILALFMLLMILAPLLVHVLENRSQDTLARPLAWVGYTWLGLLFLFISGALLLDFCRLLLYPVNLALENRLTLLIPSAQLRFYLPLLAAVLICLYGYFEALNIRTEKIVIRSPKIPAQIGKLTVVQISDVHLGLLVRHKRLEKILQLVQQANPDILVSTGDLVDGEICRMEDLVHRLQSVKPRYGKYAVTGNHEFYVGVKKAVECMEMTGFTVLRGAGVEAAGSIWIAGVDDPQGKAFGDYAAVSERDLLLGNAGNGGAARNEKFTLLLKHQPHLDKEAWGLFDLQLSGHTHKGQIFPFHYLVWLFYKSYGGLYTLGNGAHLYTSRGTGTWGPPMRFLAPPEVTVFELIHGD